MSPRSDLHDLGSLSATGASRTARNSSSTRRSSLPSESNPPSVAPWTYTLPAICHARTGTAVTESARIARYLDETYPVTPALLPADARSRQAGLVQAFATELHQKLMPLMLHAIATTLSPRSAEYFFETRPPVSEKRAGQWVVAEKAFSVVASWFDLASDGRLLLSSGGPGGDGDKITHAHRCVAGVLIWLRTMLGREDWRRMESFDEGPWKR